MTLPCGASPPARHHSAGDPADDVALILPAVVEPAAITALCHRLGTILDDPDVTSATVDTSALGRPDLAAVDVLARLELTARRRGHRLCLINTSPEMRDLLALTGLDDTLGEPDRT